MAPTPTYPNRSDLRAGQYGSGVARQAAAKALPPGPAPSETQAAALAEALGPAPGSRGPLTRPTERPDEPITAGMPIGPGAGPAANPVFPMAPPAPGSPQAIAETLRAITAIAPNANLIAVVREVERQSGSRQAFVPSRGQPAGAMQSVARRAAGTPPAGPVGAAIAETAAGTVNAAAAIYGDDIARGA